jgi:DNA-directed RNA polymerase subunit H
MHILQPKHVKLKAEEAEKILAELNISRAQLPKIKQEDSALPEGCVIGDVIKVERKFGDKTVFYYRVAI